MTKIGFLTYNEIFIIAIICKFFISVLPNGLYKEKMILLIKCTNSYEVLSDQKNNSNAIIYDDVERTSLFSLTQIFLLNSKNN